MTSGRSWRGTPCWAGRSRKRPRWIGFAALLLGAFSRFGLWRQVLGAVVLLVLVQFTDNLAADAVANGQAPWQLTYAAPVLGLVIALALLWWAGRPRSAGRAAAPSAAVPT
jgi:lipopolysaccharide export system permease protein